MGLSGPVYSQWILLNISLNREGHSHVRGCLCVFYCKFYNAIWLSATLVTALLIRNEHHGSDSPLFVYGIRSIFLHCASNVCMECWEISRLFSLNNCSKTACISKKFLSTLFVVLAVKVGGVILVTVCCLLWREYSKIRSAFVWVMQRAAYFSLRIITFSAEDTLLQFLCHRPEIESIRKRHDLLPLELITTIILTTLLLYSKTGVYRGKHYFFLFLLENIDCGYSLEPPRRDGSNEHPQSMLWAKIWKISEFLSVKFLFLEVKFSIYSRISIARTPMARSPWLIRTRFWVPTKFIQ